VRALVQAQRPRHTLIVSMQEESLYGPQVLSLGADGYLPKDSAHAHVIEATLKVLAGEIWMSPRLNTILLNRRLRRHKDPEGVRPADRERSLTLRELQVLEQLSQGKSTKEIAAALGLSVRTVDLHRSHIKKKLGLRTGAELIAFASHRQ
jgi:DNA-binding NarL/FixJ family response regulator